MLNELFPCGFLSNNRRRNLIVSQKVCSITVVLILLVGISQAVSSRWLHIRVKEAGKVEEMKLNIPLSLVETVLPLLEDKLVQGKVHLEERGFSVIDVKKVWNSLREKSDHLLADVEVSDGRLRVFIKGEFLYVRSEEDAAGQVNVSIPNAVVDGLLSGEGEEVNILAGLQALTELGDQKIVSLQIDETTVRVWIDEDS